MIRAVETLGKAARDLFDGYERTRSVSDESYAAYESAIDGVGDAFSLLQSRTRDQYARDRDSAERRSDVLTLIEALAAVAVAAAFGTFVGRRVIQPVLALRDAAVQFGAGRQDIAVPPKSNDELGELTSAFEAMMVDTRRHMELIEHGHQRLRAVFASIEEILVVCDRDTRQHSGFAAMLAFSRQHQRETGVVDLNEVLQGPGRMVLRVLRENIEVTVVPSKELCATELASGQIEQILMNLVVNARDAMPSGGNLTIEAGVVDVVALDAAKHGDLRPGRYATLAVSDDGTGMDAATQERIFEPFFTTKEQGKGTGLGLSTVFGIVHQCGGRIVVASALGSGTVVTLYFPEACRAPTIAQGRVLSAAPTSGVTETILLVEDEVQVGDLVERVLARKGYRVLAAESAEDALAICRARGDEVDLLLTDVIMPQMNGPRLAARLVAAHPRIKVLYMSGYTDDVVIDGGVKAAGAFLEKPISPTTLLRKVQHALALAPFALAG